LGINRKEMSAFTNYLRKKNKLPMSPLASGFLFFFGLDENPLQDAIDHIQCKSTKKSISESFADVSNSFHEVFEEEKSKTGK
jgi:hypothetical protein